MAWLRRGPPARTSKPASGIAAATELIANEPPARGQLFRSQARVANARLGKTGHRPHRRCAGSGASGPGRAERGHPRLGARRSDWPFGSRTVPEDDVDQPLRGAPVDLSRGTLRIGSTVVVGVLDQRLAEFDPDLSHRRMAGAGRHPAGSGRGQGTTASALLSPSASAAIAPGRVSGTSRAANCAACTCCGSCCRARTCCCWTNPATWTSRPGRSRGCPGRLARHLGRENRPIATCWSGSPDDIYAMPGDATCRTRRVGTDYLAARRSQRERGAVAPAP